VLTRRKFAGKRIRDVRAHSWTDSHFWPKQILNAVDDKPLSTSPTPDGTAGNKEFPDMDLDAQSLIKPPSSRWTMFLVFVCFAMACGFLLSSLSKGHPASAAAAPTAALSASAVT
jgi:hypothetical protein